MPDETLRRAVMTPEEPTLAGRADARISKAEMELADAKSELEKAALAAAQEKKEYEDFRRRTAAIKKLAPLIREEVHALERLWRYAEERKARRADAVDVANKELKSVYRAREQLKRMGLYIPSDGTPPTTASVPAALSAPER